MDLIANGLNGIYPRNYLPTSNDEIDSVLASVAYGSGRPMFLENVIENGWRLDLWVRYDHTVPVAVPLLRFILANNKNSVFCKLVPDMLHSKVIWWKGYGAYIGSANLSDRAWNSNIEAGIFVNSDELVSNGLDVQLEQYFTELVDLPQCVSLSKELVDNIEQMENVNKAHAEIEKKAKKLRKIPIFEGLDYMNKETAVSKARTLFLQEWNDTLTVMRNIADLVIEHRPGWVSKDTPAAWQADQFLHAYYYNRVREGASYPYEQMYKLHASNPWDAVNEGMKWWSKLAEPPSNEDETLTVLAPCIRDHLAKNMIDTIGKDEFSDICNATHATKDYISKISLSTFGIKGQSYMPHAERIEIYSEWILKARNERGEDVIGLIKWVLYGGPNAEIPERLFSAARDQKYSIPHYGLNSLAEVTGWALPDIVPPRNGRTSKALRALGFDVNPL